RIKELVLLKKRVRNILGPWVERSLPLQSCSLAVFSLSAGHSVGPPLAQECVNIIMYATSRLSSAILPFNHPFSPWICQFYRCIIAGIPSCAWHLGKITFT